jgi:alpha-galactosidase
MRPLFCLVLAATILPAADLRSCRATFDGRELTIANSRVERKWRMENGALRAISFRDLDAGVEWLSQRPAPATGGPEAAELTQRSGKLGPVEAESLVAELSVGARKYRFQVFPNARGISVYAPPGRIESVAPVSTPNTTGIETKLTPDGAIGANAIELLDLAPQHLKLTEVRLADQTDAHNELVFEDEYLLHTAERLRLSGNLFFVEDPLTDRGLIFLKEAPLPHARPVKTAADLAYDPQNRRLALLGDDYREIVLAYAGGRAGRITALQDYQRQLRVYDPKRDAMFLSNTWGDRNRDSRVTEAFLTKEVDAGARLGVDAIQIDDGWQLGRTSNSVRGNGVWSGFYAANPRFWDVDPQRFPNGLAPVVKRASGHGMSFGLWFGPDSANDFANWRKDADKILEFHRTLGIRYIKIDGVKAPTAASEQNLRRFFDRVQEESKGAVSFDLDVTAEIRPGYFGMINVGPLFVENRYTDWHRYWPHQTLRNLWKLAQYVDPLRLRMEFLNNTRNTQQYEGDPLAPSEYSPSYLFATVMMANPLGWFEVSNLPQRYFDELPPLIARWKQERPRMFAGNILPIGSAPDGVAWTGFVSTAGYALLFREANTSAEWEFNVPMFAANEYTAAILGGEGAVAAGAGKLRVKIPAARQFVWVRLEPKP